MKRRTQSQRYRKCKTARKICYPTREEAQRAGTVLIMLGKWFGRKAYTYHCCACQQWHLTKMKQPGED